MSGGPETIRAKVEARKAELRDLANAEQARVEAEQKRIGEAAKKEAEARLAKLESSAAAATPVGTGLGEATAISKGARSPRAGTRKPGGNPPDPTQVASFVDDELLQADDYVAEPEAVDEKLVDAEFESLIRRKASERWTSSENTTLWLTLVGGFIFLFIHLPLGLGMVGFSIIYSWAKQRHYGEKVRQELGLPPR